MKLTIKFIDSSLKYGVYHNKKNIAILFDSREDAIKWSSKAEEFYIKYINDYLTIDRIAEDYNISNTLAENIINIGKYINNKRS